MREEILYEVISLYDSRIIRRDLAEDEAWELVRDLNRRTDHGARMKRQRYGRHVDDIAVILAVEEHRQGKPYLADPEHCARCAEVDAAWAEATCKHFHAVEITSVGDAHRRWLCIHCSHMWFEEDA